jgi:hypothetical protein
MANKAFGEVLFGPYIEDNVLEIGFKYTVLFPTTVTLTAGNTVYVPVVYADTTASLWAKIVTAVRADLSDSTVEVVSMPSSLDRFVYANAY